MAIDRALANRGFVRVNYDLHAQPSAGTVAELRRGLHNLIEGYPLCYLMAAELEGTRPNAVVKRSKGRGIRSEGTRLIRTRHE
jgi:hypothetical protein